MWITANRAPARRSVPSMFFDEDIERDDGRKYNPQVMSFIRDDWIASQIRERYVSYFSWSPIVLKDHDDDHDVLPNKNVVASG